jgi:hypothetical protein
VQAEEREDGAVAMLPDVIGKRSPLGEQVPKAGAELPGPVESPDCGCGLIGQLKPFIDGPKAGLSRGLGHPSRKRRMAACFSASETTSGFAPGSIGRRIVGLTAPETSESK